MSRDAAVRRRVLEIFGIETPQKAVAKISTSVTGFIAVAVMLLFPAEPWWGKLLEGLVLAAVVAIIYLWTHLTLKLPVVTDIFSPFYSAAYRDQFRAEQRAKDAEIARLTFASQQLVAEMTKLDITSEEGQQKFKQLAAEKRPIDQRLAELQRLPKSLLGWP